MWRAAGELVAWLSRAAIRVDVANALAPIARTPDVEIAITPDRASQAGDYGFRAHRTSLGNPSCITSSRYTSAIPQARTIDSTATSAPAPRRIAPHR